MAQLLNNTQLNNTPLAIDTVMSTTLHDWTTKQQYIDTNGTDSVPICTNYLNNKCYNGRLCSMRHSRGDKDTFVCKHWLRNLCKKSELCEFLHEFDLSRMPPCHFYFTYGSCINDDCPFLHINSQQHSTTDCPNYTAQGFCPKGPNCIFRHKRRVFCPDYMAGFCQFGPQCPNAHPKWLMPKIDIPDINYDIQLAADRAWTTNRYYSSKIDNTQKQQHHNKIDPSNIQCNRCKQYGHIAAQCTATGNIDSSAKARPMEAVTCFKCGQKGHYANVCPNPKNIQHNAKFQHRGQQF